MIDRPTSAQIRQQFLDFFRGKGHAIVPSASLVPVDDPTLLFTNAGMNQFKEIFLGLREPEFPRVADSQKVMRVNGKHNDLDDVGRSPYHQTFFEMLGNWSFGDYYKREAITWAWELLTQVWGLPRERLWATVFEDDKGNLGRDEEAAAFWGSETTILPEHLCFFGRKDNFWEMGDSGPCGPCSEIHVDMGPEACDLQGVPGHVCAVNGACKRYIEIWNLVFIQYNRAKDGQLTDLPNRHVDTGMGFERVVGVLQDVHSNYETDLFLSIIRRTQEMLGQSDQERDAHLVSYRVIADHIRAITFLIGDGVMPANDGRGYVLRLILRRAARHGRMLGFQGPFLARLAQTVIDIMGSHYDELVRRREFILSNIEREENRFSQTLTLGLALLDDLIATLEGQGRVVIPGDEAFRLYDTFGFPLDLTQDVARDQGMTVDLPGYQAALAEQRALARSSTQFAAAETADVQVYLDVLHDLKATGVLPPAGVANLSRQGLQRSTSLAALVREGKPVEDAEPGDIVDVVVPETPFYVESGGQVSDTGLIVSSAGGEAGTGWKIRIDDTRQPIPGLTIHRGEVIEGRPHTGEQGLVVVDAARRRDIMRNHTATHLLQRALRDVLGEHVHQAGSVVAPDRLRFDFTHSAPLAAEQLETIARGVNEAILEDYPVNVAQMHYREALAAGAMALFTEKYGDEVRVVKIGDGDADVSQELCGGTHVTRTGQIGLFHIVSEESVGAGVRRIEAVTGRAAERFVRSRLQELDRVAALLHVPADQAERALRGLQSELQAAQKEAARLRADIARRQTENLAASAQSVNSASGVGPAVAVVAAQVAGADVDTLREMSDWLRNKLGSSAVVLAADIDGKPQLIAAVTDDLVKRGLHAGELVKAVAKVVGGGGGGKPALAQAGGRDLARLPEALALVPELVAKALTR
jgi:alanyl-tRNA synthetase